MTNGGTSESVTARREMSIDRPAEDKAAGEKDQLRRAKEMRERFKPLAFIVVTLAAWWLIIVLANVAITCVPGGAPCGASGPLIPSMDMSKIKWALVLISVIAALWVAKMMVYPNRDFADQ